MKLFPWMVFAAMTVSFCGCATHVSSSKQQQVELATQTGPYSYLHTTNGPMR